MPLLITGLHTGSNKINDPYLAINALAWVDEHLQNNGIIPVDILFDRLDDNGIAWVVDEPGNKIKLQPAITGSGSKHVRTIFDNTKNRLAAHAGFQ